MSNVKNFIAWWMIISTLFFVGFHLTSPVYGQGFNGSLSGHPEIFTNAATKTVFQDTVLTEPHYLSVSNFNSATRIPKGSNLTEQAELSAGLQGAVEITSYRFITGYIMLLSFSFLFIIMFKERKLNLIEEKTLKIKKNKARLDATVSTSTLPIERYEQDRWPESLNILFHRVIDILRERKPYRHSMYNIEEMAEQLNSYAYYIEAAVKVNTGRSFEELLLLYRMNDVLVHIELNRGCIDRRTLMLKCGFTELKQLENVFKTHIGVDIDTYRYMIQNSDK